jgi:hypothetical protein
MVKPRGGNARVNGEVCLGGGKMDYINWSILPANLGQGLAMLTGPTLARGEFTAVNFPLASPLPDWLFATGTSRPPHRSISWQTASSH